MAKLIYMCIVIAFFEVFHVNCMSKIKGNSIQNILLLSNLASLIRNNHTSTNKKNSQDI